MKENIIDFKSEIEKFKNGDGHLKPVIESIRNYLGNIDVLKKAKGGVIMFFEKRENSENDLTLQLFPFKLNTQIFENNNPIITDEALHKIFSKINEKKPYSIFLHYDHFKNKFNSNEHLHIDIKDINKNFVFYYDKYQKEDWEVFAEKVANGDINKNLYEQVLIGSGVSQVAFIPIPVLSTPSVLLAIDSSHFDKAGLSKLATYTAVYFRSRDIVAKYLYSRLLTSLRSFLKDRYQAKKKTSEIELVVEYCKELCHILLPISYKVEEMLPSGIVELRHEEDYYIGWPSNENESTYTLNLIDKYKVEFKLTTFVYYKFDKDDKDDNDDNFCFIDESAIYKSGKQQSTILIQLLFDALHDTWKLMNEIEINVINRLLENLDELSDNIGYEVSTKIKQKFADVKKEALKNTNYSPKNVIDVIFPINNKDDKGAIYLKVDNVVIIDYEEYSDDKLCGYIYLYEIIKKYHQAEDSVAIDIQELVESAETPKQKKIGEGCTLFGKKQSQSDNDETTDDIDDDIEEDIYEDRNEKTNDEYTSQQLVINGAIESICCGIKMFLSANKKEIAKVKAEQKISQKNEFNETLAFYSKTTVDITFKPIAIKQSHQNLFNQIRDIAKIYMKHDENKWREIYKKSKIDNTDVNTALKKIDELGSNKTIKYNIFKHAIRACLKDLIRLKHGASVAPIERLIKNLEQSGLVKKGGKKGLYNKAPSCRYFQANLKENRIKWEFEQ